MGADRKAGGDYYHDFVVERKSKREYVGDKDSGGGRRGGKRYQSSRTITKRKDNQKQYGDALAMGFNSQELNKQLQANLPEDMRISKLLRRLCQETDVKTCLDLCSKLGVVVLEPCNTSYVRKSFDILADGIMSVLENGPRDCVEAVADVFGMMGYVSRNDFNVYRAWIAKYYKYSKKLRRAMLRALKKTVALDTGDDLKDMAGMLLDLLKDYLEAADTVEAFVAIIEIVGELSNRYHNHFKPHFNDVVDIVVGWHLETDQSADVKRHCTKVLLSFKHFWYEDMKFTLNLLSQFIEDIGVCCEDLETSDPVKEKAQFISSAIAFSSLLDAFNTVIKCLFATPESLLQSVGKDILDSSFELVVKGSALVANGRCLEEVLLPINESLIILLMVEPCAITVGVEEVFLVIQAEIRNVEHMNKCQISSLLLLLFKYVEYNAGNLSTEFLNLLWDPNSTFVKLRYHQAREVQEGLLKLYHRILAIKNVDILQRAYKFILDDLDQAMLSMQNSSCSAADRSRTQFDINFNLLTISTLAIANSSILVMWTLQPSILVVLLEKLRLLDIDLWSNHQSLHYAILRVAYQHCLKNNNFISSSALLRAKNYSLVDSFNHLALETSPASSTSPTAEHFRIIIEFLEKALPKHKDIYHLEMLLDWCHAVILQSSQYSDVLLGNRSFTAILQSICDISMRTNKNLTLKCAECLDLASSYKQLAAATFQSIAEVCCVHLCAVNAEIRQRFSFILGKLPLRFSLKQVSQFTGNNQRRSQHIYELQSWYVSTENTGDLRSQYFRNFIEKIGFHRDTEAIDEFLMEAFTKSWFVSKDKNYAYGNMALNDLRCLVPWVQWEAAHFCVNNKLRTPLGKPQETFLKIESIIKEDARVLSLKERTPVRDINVSMENQRHARILLGFLEALEKAIYNAAEGTAFALPNPEKPARTFFRVNAPTCAEWFNRIRTAVDLVALHCMEPEMVIRYSEAVLKELLQANKVNDLIFEHTLMSLVWALLRSWESDALYGVYVWAKKVTGRKYQWIKMAAEEAAGHRETATEGFLNILADPESANMDRHIRDFIADQITLTLIFTDRLPELYDFLVAEETSETPRVTIPLFTFTSKQVKDWMAYEKTKDKNVIDMSHWEMVELGTDVPNNFSCYKILCDTENTIALTFLKQFATSKDETLRICNEVIHSALQECLLTKSREHLFQLIITNHVAHIATLNEYTPDHSKSIRVEKHYGSLAMMRVLHWSEFFDDSKNCEQYNMEMRLDLASVARKENNFKLCQHELNKFYKSSKLARELNLENQLNVETAQQHLLGAELGCKIWDVSLSRAVYEQCKWLYCQPGRRQEAIQFASQAARMISEQLSNSEENASDELRERKSRFLLTLADWVQNEDIKLIQQDSSTALNGLIASLPDVTPSAESRMISIFSCMDIVVGKILQASTETCPELAKAWCQFASWCYRWGKKMVEFNTEANTAHNVNLEEINKILPSNLSEEVQKSILLILNQHEVISEEEEFGLNETSSTDLLEALKETVPELHNCPPEKLQSIVEIWRQTHKTVYGYYEAAASAYFRFLELSSSIEMENEYGNSSTVTATLRLLRLIVKHALGLKEVLERGLASTPTKPWRVITPQLFSRLNHHEPYVRKRVSELLCRVAKDAPQLIIFPAVVGSVQEKKVDINELSGGDSAEPTPKDSGDETLGLVYCFNALLDILSRDAPETVQQVKVLVHELRRISLLWDEFWVISMQQIYSEYNKSFINFENELAKITESGQLEKKRALLIEKHKLLHRPLVFVLEQLYEMTSRSPETIHERHFQDRFLKYISMMIEKFKEPLDFSKPNQGWTQFKFLFGQMQQRGQKRTAFSLRLSEISPVLAKLSNTAISMPGIESTQMQQILIRSVDNLVQILPTKTKPKKLMFYGNDGRRYSYLFKGLEDLHLDERIMQFLSIANLMMTKSIDCNGNITYYRAEHYSVIPLGPRSGLINWVDNTVPIFSLYKKWQQREALQKKDKPGTVTRPSELYYQKLTPLLQQHGMKTTDNRKDWPVQALKQVLKELQEETPRDLLARELWCHSTTAATWRQVIRNYSLSMAVMSVIGYIIGLGDRHLDNVLVKLASGEIVHIDYNVCFEKGKTLRVPEKVPFRMTPNLEEALGITGIEGTFRLACEHVLKSLKKGRETLLTLLEAFVYDPLVDWAISEDGGTAGFAVSTYGNREGFNSDLREAKKQLEREVNRDTLAIRFSEIKPGWNRNRDDIYQNLLLMENFLHELQSNRTDLVDYEKQRDSLSRQIQLIKEAESLNSAIGSHPLNTLSQRYSVYKKIVEERNTAKKVIEKRASESEKTLEGYRSFMKDIESGKLQEYLRSINANPEQYVSSEFELVEEFLNQSNLRDTFLTANACRHELNENTFHTTVLVKRALETLSQFSAIICYYPKDYEQTHLDYKYLDWCRKLVSEGSASTCQEITQNYQQFLANARQHSCGPQVLSFSYQLKNIISDTAFKLSELVACNAQELNESTVPIDQLYENALSTINAIALGNTNGRQSLLFAGLQLCMDLNHNYLLMEQTASTAGDSLIDLQLNDNWFLPEFYMSITQLSALYQILFEKDTKKASSDCYATGLSCLSACVGIFDHLHNMNECIAREFLSDTMQGIISENQSVIDMISAVSNLQTDFIPVAELLNELNMHLQCVVMNVPSAHAHALDSVEELKRKLAALGDSFRNQEAPTEGSKLYLTLHQFFHDLLEKQNTLMHIVYERFLTIQEADYIDHIKDSKDLAVLIFNKSTYNVLEAIFVVKRVQAMVEFFTSCLQMACAFKGTCMATAFNDDTLVRPIRKFIADFVYHCMLGIGPAAAGLVTYGILLRINPHIKQDSEMIQQMTGTDRVKLSDLYNENIDRTMSAEQISGLDLNQATNACLHLSFTWRKMMKVKLLSERIMTEQISVTRSQMLFVAHSWLHELSTADSSPTLSQNDLTIYADGSLILVQLKNLLESLTSSKVSIMRLRDDITASTNAILHRLKWASGANPELVHLLKSFEQASIQKRDFMDEQLLYLDIALKHCSSILNYQIVRMQVNRQTEQDLDFIHVIERYRKACIKLNSCSAMVNQTEIALVELLDPEGQIDHIWLSNVKALIDDMTDQVQSKIAQTEKIVRNAQDKLHMSANELKELMGTHHSLASDIRNLLKMKLKMETTPTLREYLLRYKAFLETVSELYSNVLSKDFTDEMVCQAKEQVRDAMPNVHKIFDQLFQFEQSGNVEDESGVPGGEEEADKLSAEMMESPVKRHHMKAQRTQKEQKRNAYAVSVWRRIRMKLEGRDPDPNRRCTAQEQVEWMIREAMDPDNLAVLYEGWTPWV